MIWHVSAVLCAPCAPSGLSPGWLTSKASNHWCLLHHTWLHSPRQTQLLNCTRTDSSHQIIPSVSGFSLFCCYWIFAVFDPSPFVLLPVFSLPTCVPISLPVFGLLDFYLKPACTSAVPYSVCLWIDPCLTSDLGFLPEPLLWFFGYFWLFCCQLGVVPDCFVLIFILKEQLNRPSVPESAFKFATFIWPRRPWHCLFNEACLCLFLLDNLPDFQTPACVLNPDLTHTEPCRRLLLVGFVCLPLDCLSVYWTLLVKDFDYSLPLSLSRAIWVLLTTTPITIRSPKSSSQPYHI